MDIEQKKKLGSYLKAKRTMLGYTQEYIATDILNVRSIQRIENGDVFPNFKNLSYLCSKMQLELTNVLKFIYFPKLEIVHFDVLIIHKINLNDLAVSKLKEELRIIFNSEYLHYLPYEFMLEVLFLDTFFDIQLFSETLEITIKSIIKKKTVSEMEAGLVSLIFKKNLFSQEKAQFIENWKYYNGAILAVIYSICIGFYNEKKKKKIIEITTDVLERENSYKDTRYLPHMYAQKGVAEYFLNNYEVSESLEQALLLTKLLNLTELHTFLNEIIQGKSIH